LQGGGLLGAYETWGHSCDVQMDQVKLECDNIDAIVGTYIGAINGALLVSPVIENKRRDE
jgi:hypothetical protein